MFLGNPELELRLYGEEYQDSYSYDEDGNEYEYDEFIGKWIRKRKEKRSKNPKVIARRKKRDERRIEKGKDPRYTVRKKPIPPKEKIVEEKTTVQPLTKKEAQVHKNVNKAIQEELKTKQEELKTLGLEKKVDQEDLKAENQKAKTQLASTGKGMIWLVAIVGGIWVLSKVAGAGKPAQAPAPSAA